MPFVTEDGAPMSYHTVVVFVQGVGCLDLLESVPPQIKTFHTCVALWRVRVGCSFSGTGVLLSVNTVMFEYSRG